MKTDAFPLKQRALGKIPAFCGQALNYNKSYTEVNCGDCGLENSLTDLEIQPFFPMLELTMMAHESSFAILKSSIGNILLYEWIKIPAVQKMQTVWRMASQVPENAQQVICPPNHVRLYIPMWADFQVAGLQKAYYWFTENKQNQWSTTRICNQIEPNQ